MGSGEVGVWAEQLWHEPHGPTISRAAISLRGQVTSPMGSHLTFLWRKGYLRAVGESEPGSLPHSFTILAPVCSHGCSITLFAPSQGTQTETAGHGILGDPHVALGLHGAYSQHRSTGNYFHAWGHQHGAAVNGIPLFQDAEHSMTSFTPIWCLRLLLLRS